MEREDQDCAVPRERDVVHDAVLSPACEEQGECAADPFSRFGFTTRALAENSELPSLPIVSNRLVLELMQYVSNQRDPGTHPKRLLDFVCKLSGSPRAGDLPCLSTFWARAKAIVKKRSNLAKTKRASAIQGLENWEQEDSIILSASKLAQSSKTAAEGGAQSTAVASGGRAAVDDQPGAGEPSADDYFMAHAHLDVADQLGTECHELKVEMETLQERAMSPAEIQNIRRREKRKNSVIAEQRAELKRVKREISDLKDDAHAMECDLTEARARDQRLAKQVQYWKDKSTSAADEMEESAMELELNSQEEISHLHSNIKDLKVANAALAGEVEALKQAMKAVDTGTVDTMIAGKIFTASVRKCCMDLLSRIVGINNVEPIMRSVASLCGRTLGRLPQPSKLSEMYVEAATLSQVQLSDLLVSADNVTLHSDGTTKFGQKYMSFQVSCDY